MKLTDIRTCISALPTVSGLVDAYTSHSPGRTSHIERVSGSLPAFVIAALSERVDRPILCLTPDPDSAAYLRSDLEQLRVASPLLEFPPTGHKPYDSEQMVDAAPLIRRADTLRLVAETPNPIVITSVDAIFELVPSAGDIQKRTLVIRIGENRPPESIVEHLVQYGFDVVDFVEQPGELAPRGGILDVYPFAGDFPIRLEFFGDTIDSIREFDVRTQRSVSRLESAALVPNLDTSDLGADYGPFFDSIPAPTTILIEPEAVTQNCHTLWDAATAAWSDAAETTDAPPDRRYAPPDTIAAWISNSDAVVFGALSGKTPEHTISLGAIPQPLFKSNIGQLRSTIEANRARNVHTTILCDSRGQKDRLEELLEKELAHDGLSLTVDTIHQGFELREHGLAVYTDHQIFDRYHRPRSTRKARLGGLSLRELQHLTPGDFVVHVDHGVGRFDGMQTITVRGRKQEAVRLLYRDKDKLFVSVNALQKLHRFTGKEGHQPQLTKLGSGTWERTKARTKKRVKDIARDLIKLYAKRRATPGHAFPDDTVWQREMEASFEFEDTPDQATASEAVKRDMEQPVPMDRLVCGDVGFGKTEVAIRAAFKAVQDGKQVAILVPTTVLAAQHHDTFSQRLSRFPVRVDVVSRFRTPADQKAIVKATEEGKVDILIGTQRLTSKDVKFKDLGLMIIDEEQRFGVSVKERLRKLRIEVDTLTLTATPIPRTLQFSLLGARDLSIIETAPPNRQPILTEIHTFDKNLVRDAIRYEINRGGQVFFIHNRVSTIVEVSEMLRGLVPDVRMQVAHGQMKGSQLERIMVDFKSGKYQVLVSTNIIENGLDIANANTMIIDRADRFGLAELHQLRGRVGRSDRKAFCYLLVPSIHGLTREAQERLRAVEEFSDLGSGFNLAMRDLDIRGAGSMLGGEQSGFIEEVGFETYHKILDEAVRELRATEFADVFDISAAPPAPETTVEIDADALIPADYVTNRIERLNLYRRIGDAKEDAVLTEFLGEMEDRFGDIPPPVQALIDAARLRQLGQLLRIHKVVYKNERLFLHLPKESDDAYFYEAVFRPLLESMSALQNRYVLKDSTSGRTRAIVQDVAAVGDAISILNSLSSIAQVAAITA